LLGAAPSVAVPSLLSEALSFAALARAPSRSAVEFVSFRFHYQHDGQRVFGVNDGGSDLEIREIDRHGVVTRAYVVGSMLYFESTDQGWYRFDEVASYRRLVRTHPASRASAGSASHPDLTLRSLPDRIVGGRVFGAWRTRLHVGGRSVSVTCLYEKDTGYLRSCTGPGYSVTLDHYDDPANVVRVPAVALRAPFFFASER
jgi:hypothetical protein